MEDYVLSETDRGDGPNPPGQTALNLEAPQIDASRAALVKKWEDEIKYAAKHHSKAFKRMKKCQQLAKDGASKEWAEADRYVAPILPRHINQTVASLYAKNPQAYYQRKKRMMYPTWDGKPESLQQAVASAQKGDPTAYALLQEVVKALEYNDMLEKLGRTAVICWDYYTSEQEFGFKAQLKALVRRTKVNGVGYVKLCYQRVLKPNPEVTAQISDITAKLARLEKLAHEASEGELQPDAAEMEEMRLSLQDLQQQEMIMAREGLVFDFPRSDEVIIDPECRHLKTFAGASYIVQQFNLTPSKIEEIYGVDVGDSCAMYSPSKTGGKNTGKRQKDSTARVYEVWDKVNRQVFTICEGYGDFIREPATPDVDIERFFTIFPLVFNEIESDDDIFPPSDVWNARHIQSEYNRSRESLRQHRRASRPYYVASEANLEEEDLKKLADHEDHEIIRVKQLLQGQKVEDLLQRGPTIPIDPNQYQVEEIFSDLLRSVGTQEANLGGTSSSTATESSIAEQSRSASLADNVDELDDLLSNLAHSSGQLMLKELSKDTVIEIAGPGAVWPETPMTRADIAKDLVLSIKAGSSGRPNRAAELANRERALPFLMQLPGSSAIAIPLLKDYLNLLDIDVDELELKGMPSIQAVNAALMKPAQITADPNQNTQGADPRTAPDQQGAQGADNAPQATPSGQGQAPYPTSAGLGSGIPANTPLN
jgi:hypothetical protein